MFKNLENTTKQLSQEDWWKIVNSLVDEMWWDGNVSCIVLENISFALQQHKFENNLENLQKGLCE